MGQGGNVRFVIFFNLKGGDNTMKIKVKKIIDGDTFQDTHNRFFRLANVDAPEKTKRGYQKAKQSLTKLINEEKLLINKKGTSYNRIVVDARKQGEKITINEKMRRKGY